MVIIKVIIVPFVICDRRGSPGFSYLLKDSFQKAFTMNLILITFVYCGFQSPVSARPSVSEETIQGKCKPQDTIIKDEMHLTTLEKYFYCLPPPGGS